MPAHFWADITPFRWVILLGFVDPVVVVIGLWMGWHADQKAKLFLAGLAAALAGVAKLFLAGLAAALAGVAISFLFRLVGLGWFEGGYAFGGLHAVTRVVAGMLWAALGYAARRVRG